MMALSPSVSQLERVNLFILPQQHRQNPVLMPLDLSSRVAQNFQHEMGRFVALSKSYCGQH